MKNVYRFLITLLFAFWLSGCLGAPEGIKPIASFEPTQYVGNWYEIARLDHAFERGLENVTATYNLREDGGLDVINRGYDAEKKEWQQAEGTAYFVDPPNADGTWTGKLKVSFLGPLYGAYNIIELDKPYYNYVMVSGADRSYFWILSRTPQLPYPIKAQLLGKAKALGFATDKLIFVKQ